MEKKTNFGELSAENIKIGDIVAWNKWNMDKSGWIQHLGVVLEVKNAIVSNRMVCNPCYAPKRAQNTP